MAQDEFMTSRLGFAISEDGTAFKSDECRDVWAKSGAIIFQRENSRTVATKIDGKYWMYFGDTKLFITTSDDLVT